MLNNFSFYLFSLIEGLKLQNKTLHLPKIIFLMKNIIILSLFFTLLFSCSNNKKQNYTEEIEEYRYKTNVFFLDKKTSPLKEIDFKKFKALSYFPIDEKYNIVSHFEKTPNEVPFEMQTSTDRKSIYTQYGIASFKINGKNYSLRIYKEQISSLQTDFSEHLFLPFNDLTNGNETYAAGRYLDVDSPNGDTIILDFNKAYNPYCAYNEKWSCPIPPKENNLNVAIKAGILNSTK